MTFDIGKLASVVAECNLGIRELRVQTKNRRYYFLSFEDDRPHSWWEESMFHGSESERMTDAQALSEIEEAKRILDKHYDSGFLLGIWNECDDGICYRYADGRYAELAKRESEDEAA